jgi:putative CocE/NonD family hydrolase
MPRRLALTAVLLLFCPGALGAQQPLPAQFKQQLEHIKAHYTKYEYRIPMRDGKRLFTAVYVPKDAKNGRTTYPILLNRTPYSVRPYGVDQYRPTIGPSSLFIKESYIFAYQDVRGRWMSEGEFVNMRPQLANKGARDVDESTDTYDTIDWLVKKVPGNNGKVGMYGTSYPGFYTAAGMIDAHPALKAASPQAPINDWFMGDDWHHNGALMLPHVFNFMAVFGRPRPQPTKEFNFTFKHGTPDGYQFFLRMGPLANANAKYFKNDVAFWNEVLRHETYDDFWQARNLRPHLKDIKPAVLTVGGWFDAENLFGALETFKKVEANSPKLRYNTLVMGPWRHGGWNGGTGESLGHVRFNAKTSVYFRENIELPFFNYHLKGKGPFHAPKAWVFETATNQWRQFDRWPPTKSREKAFYFRAGGRLSSNPPGKAGANDAFDEYVSDPAKPVPYVEKVVIGMTPEYMVDDQRFAGRRPDVLVYETDVLEEDVRVAGPVEVSLHVSTSGTDSDWVVKVIDVYPDDYPDPDPNPTGVKMGGYQQLVRGDVMRGKFRTSFQKPEPFSPGKPTAVKFTLPDICHVFRPGHRIMVQVQSSWFPLVDRNPQTFVDIPRAKASDFRKATQRVYRSPERPSHVTVRVLP